MAPIAVVGAASGGDPWASLLERHRQGPFRCACGPHFQFQWWGGVGWRDARPRLTENKSIENKSAECGVPTYCAVLG